MPIPAEAMPGAFSSLFLVAHADATVRGLLLHGIDAVGGRDVVCAADGGDALRRAQERWPDIVLTGRRMRPVDGLVLAHHLKRAADRAGPPPWIVMVSADGRAAPVREAVAAGADDYLLVPFTLRQLERRLLRAVWNARGGRRTVVHFDRRVHGSPYRSVEWTRSPGAADAEPLVTPEEIRSLMRPEAAE